VPLTRKKSFRFYGYGDLCFYPHYILFYFMIPKECKRLAEVRGLKLKKVGSLFPMRLRAYDYENLINRDKASLDVFWLRDESLEESDNLPDPDVLAQEIVEGLEAALEQFREITADLGGKQD